MLQKITCAALCLLLIAGCKNKDDDDARFSNLECIQMADQNGNPIGVHPANCDFAGQWKQSTLSADDLSYLEFSDTITGNLAQSATIEKALAYPNPIAVDNVQFYTFLVDEDADLKLKLAIVDQEGNAIQQIAHRLTKTDNRSLALLLPADLYTIGEFYRVFYQVSGANGQVFFEGFGNILVCQNAPLPNIEACT